MPLIPEPGGLYDDEIKANADAWINHYWAGTFPSGMASDPGPLIAMGERLLHRSKQVNQILYILAVGAGFEDKGGRVDAKPQDIMSEVISRLELADWYLSNDAADIHEGKVPHWCGCGDLVELRDESWERLGCCVNCAASKGLT